MADSVFGGDANPGYDVEPDAHAATFWLTGLPCSGKSTLARAVRDRIPGLFLLDSDEARFFLTPSPTYAPGERETVYRAISYTAAHK